MARTNPAVSATQYRLAQAVLSGSARATSMSKKAAREIVDRTPAKLRSLFSHSNQGVIPSIIGYDLAGRAISIGRGVADKATRKIMGRRNSAAASAEAYESFHGHEPDTDAIIETDVHQHTNLAGIGELCWLVVRYEEGDDTCDVTIENFNGALLAQGEDSKRPQLFIEGGDQSVDLKAFGISPPLHEYETLGRMVCVSYFTDKSHLGAEGGEAEYVHVIEPPLDDEEFAAWGLEDLEMSWEDVEQETEGARGPDVVYSTHDKTLMFSGGSYLITPEGVAH